MNPDDLKKILDALSSADVREFSLKTGSFDLDLKRGPQAQAAQRAAAPTPAPVSQSAPENTVAAPTPAAEVPLASAPAQATPAQAEADAEAVAPAPKPAVSGTPVKAPIVGTFYAASSPDADPYVKVGDSVKEGQVLCIIEAMKLMNEIEAEQSGVIREISVQNGEPVEFGQTLFIIE